MKHISVGNSFLRTCLLEKPREQRQLIQKNDYLSIIYKRAILTRYSKQYRLRNIPGNLQKNDKNADILYIGGVLW